MGILKINNTNNHDKINLNKVIDTNPNLISTLNAKNIVTGNMLLTSIGNADITETNTIHFSGNVIFTGTVTFENPVTFKKDVTFESDFVHKKSVVHTLPNKLKHEICANDKKINSKLSYNEDDIDNIEIEI